VAKREIIVIDEGKCNGCKACIPNCPEGAIQVIDGKARLVSDLFCDGLGACIGHCPRGAISIEKREAGGYDEKKVIVNIARQGKNVLKAHLEHLKSHNQVLFLRQAMDYLRKNNISIPESACPGSRVMDFRKHKGLDEDKALRSDASSCLKQWPVQLMLVPPSAPYLKDADLLIAADCVPFAYADFHQGLLKGKVLLVGCPKLDDISVYQEKIDQILKHNNIKSITYAHMEVPCCFGLVNIIKSAISASGKEVRFEDVNISIKGEMII
jgi:ferredoxin